MGEMTQVGTPRPAPQFFQEPLTFSTKKARGTPKDSLPPKPPVKSAPPVSRIFPHKPQLRALPVSFKNSSADSSILSPHYNDGLKKTFCDQLFTIESKLGTGSFGEVFKVRSKEDGKLYAIKRSRERFKGESDRRRKLDEVDKCERLPKHANCVEFVKAWEEKNHLYIQTELCKTSLSNYAESVHNIPETLIWNYLVDLLMAVKHLHDHDLIHMDIKPENIFITDNEVCKLGDFGLVLDLSQEIDLSEAQEGDPKYLAPELMQGRFGKPADVFSLGVTFLELASDLDMPRGGELWHQLRSGSLPEEFLLGVSENLRQILHLMMEPQPINRSTVDDLLCLPIIKEIYTRRKREQTLQSAVLCVRSLGYRLFSVVLTFWLKLIFPLQRLLPRQLHTPTPRDKPQGQPMHWDHSFSDDDPFEDEGISIHNNSMGVPLDYSTSSDESMRDNEGFLVPNIPVRKAQTTPSYRHNRPPRIYMSQGSESPVLGGSHTHSRGNFFSSSPVHTPAHQSGYELNDSITPNSSFHENFLERLEAEDDDNKFTMEPKNLLNAFEASFDE